MHKINESTSECQYISYYSRKVYLAKKELRNEKSAMGNENCSFPLDRFNRIIHSGAVCLVNNCQQGDNQGDKR